MEKKNLKRITIISVLLSFIFTGGIFAYWASNVLGTTSAETTQIEVGVGLPAETQLSLVEAQRTSGKLVPSGYETTGSVSDIVIVYEVTLVATDEGATGAVATLTVEYGVLASDLLNVDISIPDSEVIVGGNSVNVTITITLDEPQNQAEYDSVANLQFDIPLTFTATI